MIELILDLADCCYICFFVILFLISLKANNDRVYLCFIIMMN